VNDIECKQVQRLCVAGVFVFSLGCVCVCVCMCVGCVRLHACMDFNPQLRGESKVCVTTNTGSVVSNCHSNC
jgi:hypothetical protein